MWVAQYTTNWVHWTFLTAFTSLSCLVTRILLIIKANIHIQCSSYRCSQFSVHVHSTNKYSDQFRTDKILSDNPSIVTCLDLMTDTRLLLPPPFSAIFCINYPKAITAALLTTLPRESDCSEQLGLSSLFYISMLLILARREETNS